MDRRYLKKDKKYLLNRYAHYYEYLQTLGKIPLNESALIENLNPNRGLLQSCYKEMKELNFNGNLVDYLCWISSLYLIDRAGDENLVEYIKKNYDSIKEDANNLLRLAHKSLEKFFTYADEKELLFLWHDKYSQLVKR